jgi:indolepyruvate ferredoxin oxidoreductase alpha subunit
VIDKGLAQVQDLIKVGWSVSEAVSVGVGHGHTLAGEDCVVTMKIPGLYQAGDLVTSVATFVADRGALVLYVAADFTPSSTQHVIDPRYLYKSCFLPVFEPRNHQELHESAQIAADIARAFNTPVVIQPSGVLCHSEGLVRLMNCKTRELANVAPLKELNALPGTARKNYDIVMEKRMPALKQLVEDSPLNVHIKGAGKTGVITHGVNALYIEEYKKRYDPQIDIFSLGFTNPLPFEKLRRFADSIQGEVIVIEDGHRFIQEACLAQGIDVTGKPEFSNITEWTPQSIAQRFGHPGENIFCEISAVPRPPMICAGCPYRLFGIEVARMRRRGKLEAVFGDIGCNTLLYFMDALETGLAMGASESKRTGYILSKPESANKCISVLGDGTECHSGMGATRNAVFRNVPGVKVVLDNEWTAMTGGQPSPSSPVNLAGDKNRFSLTGSLKAQGAKVVEIDAYNLKEVRNGLKQALKDAETGNFTCVVIKGTCIKKVPKSSTIQVLTLDPELCIGCKACNICPGIEMNQDNQPQWNNLCSGCVSQTPACLQMCPKGAIGVETIDLAAKNKVQAAGQTIDLPQAPEEIVIPELEKDKKPQRLSLSIRGVGGQGNLFFGKVMSRMAFLAGYGEDNIIKGETHGMAQMGGPVISTFACGSVFSPVLVPNSADALILMEKSELLRPGFLEMLKPGGTILMANTRILPQGLGRDQYPSDDILMKHLEQFRVIQVDVLDAAMALGDASGRSANVVMLGALSKTAPFDTLPEEMWLTALKNVSPKPAIWAANYAAFVSGRNLL